jgi:hypothetical protein
MTREKVRSIALIWGNGFQAGKVLLPAPRCEPPFADQQTHRTEPIFRMYVP